MRAIIIAGDEEDREFLSFVLRHTGLSVARSAQVQLVTASLMENPVDLVVLAAGRSTPVLEAVRTLRTATQAPIITLTDPPTEMQHCDLLDAGVDLVLARPLSPRILTRYVRMFLRRVSAVPISVLPTVEADGVTLNPTTRTVTLPQQPPQQLTLLEFRLLYVLMTNHNQVIPIELIVERVWGYEGEGNRDLVRGLVRRLRRKIESDTDTLHYIHNLPGIGYRFAAEDAPRT